MLSCDPVHTTEAIIVLSEVKNKVVTVVLLGCSVVS